MTINFGLNCFRKMLSSIALKNRTAKSSFYYRNISGQYRQDVKANAYLKPPNILLYAPSRKDASVYTNLLEECLVSDRYIAYTISSAKFNSDPWMDNVAALVIWASDSVINDAKSVENIKVALKSYSQIGGKILCFNPLLIDDIKVKTVLRGENSGEDSILIRRSDKKYQLCRGLWNCDVIESGLSKSLLDVEHENEVHSVAGEVDASSGTTVVSSLTLLENSEKDRASSRSQRQLLSYLLHCLGLESLWGDNNSTPTVMDSKDADTSKAFLFTASEKLQIDFIKMLNKDANGDSKVVLPGMTLVPLSSEENVECSGNSSLLVTYAKKPHQLNDKCLFDWDAYESKLNSKRYGKVVVYADVITSTMSVYDGILTKLSNDFEVIAIARQQSKGQGRSSNKWLSPVGCAMFTLVVHIPLKSHLGNRLPFLQHLTSVAVVHGIRSLPGLQDVNLTVKWPNDMYFGSTIKLGGVIVKSTIMNNMCIASIGCGINIANEKPTACVNGLLKDEYQIERVLKCEEVIASTVSVLEQLIDEFQNNGPESFLKLYYKYWMHSNTEVSVEFGGCFMEATIVGVDDCGFLLARRHDNGEVISLHPDGNSFDITKNLVVAKEARVS